MGDLSDLSDPSDPSDGSEKQRMSETVDHLSFEDAVLRLEQIVASMEEGNLSLDDSLRCFEEAVALSRHCAGKLEQAERKIAVLTADGGSRPLDGDFSGGAGEW